MKKELLGILEKYKQKIPNEKDRQDKLISFLNKQDEDKITDWNNFEGHIVASGFIYAKNEKKFLVLYHKDMKMYLYPGGHMDKYDKTPLSAAIREIAEETSIRNIEQINIVNDALIPIDIDTHLIKYNERLNLPEHFHFDFRYLFTVEKTQDINVDTEELSKFKWISISELLEDKNYGNVALKICNLLE